MKIPPLDLPQDQADWPEALGIGDASVILAAAGMPLPPCPLNTAILAAF
jgi:hypothetical protein